MNRAAWQRVRYIAYKELLHIVRDPQSLFFILFIPIAEMFLLGFAINTNVRKAAPPECGQWLTFGQLCSFPGVKTE